MSNSVRASIIELYRARGAPTPLEHIAVAIGMTPVDFRAQLDSQPRLAAIDPLELSQAVELIEFYGPELLFEEELTRRIREVMHVRVAIEKIKHPPAEREPRGRRAMKSLSIRPIRPTRAGKKR